MNISIDFDNKEFYEFIWFIERLSKQREMENRESKNGKTSLGGILGA